ncbi:helix-turn-helix transcriptional regulator [Actinomadura sp. HBU206391]|uniref:helix-turn-helix transcriptional regulator n=1 Tax=Actinomadura sp. HBU206391 TaxID=2731692 RepID=UPI00164F1796|nr:LuxR C-terminal-related transcriptional regulator [Actinomadura sp. HBU206391]MBC6462337.1 response regulator transcription factor [Actinomadura sp. HBU206391]
MPTHRQVAVAAEIGMLAGDPAVAAASARALTLLADLLRSDAASLVGVDPVKRDHRQITQIEYSPDVAHCLAVEFPRTPWFGIMQNESLPPSISTEPGQTFRKGYFYEQHLRPAGFHDGMTGALRRNSRYIGMVHLSSTRHDTYDKEARRLLASVLPAFAVMADALGRIAGQPEVPETGSAALVSAKQIVELPEREVPAVLADPTFGHLVEEFDRTGGHRLRFLWPAGRDWNRVTVHRAVDADGAVLVHAAPAKIPYGLSSRELDVLTRMAMGLSNRAIAEGLFLSPRTVHSHVARILQKTGTAGRSEVAALAIRENLVRPVPGLPRYRGVGFFVDRFAG